MQLLCQHYWLHSENTTHLLSLAISCEVYFHNNINSISLLFSSMAKWSPSYSYTFMNFHTGARLPDKVRSISFEKYVFPLPPSSWQLSLSSHQVTVISVFLGCHCKFVERKEFAVPGDYLCCVGCNHRVRKGCCRHQ